MPGPAFMDTGEFQTVTYVLGIAHPTGYPFYTIFGKLFGTLIPIGGWAWRMNLLSSLSAAIAAGMLAAFAVRQRVSAIVAIAAALGFAWSLNTWRSADHADPYSLTVMIAAALWLMATKWADTADRRWLWGMALVSGLGLGSAGVLAMELPAIILFVLVSRPREFLRPMTMMVAALIGIVGIFVIYAYLPLRSAMHPPLNYGSTYTWKGFKFVALGGQVGGITNYLTVQGLRIFVRRFHEAIEWYGEWLTPKGFVICVLLSICGLGSLAARRWQLALCALIGFLVPIYPTLTMPINDTTHYLLISNWLLFFTVAVGVESLVMSPIARLENGGLRLVFLVPAYGLLIVASCALAKINWDQADMHEYNDAEILAQGVFSHLKPNAVIFCWWGPSAALWYGKYVEGLRPDVEIYDDSRVVDLGWRDSTVGMALFYGKRPVYSAPYGDQFDLYQRKFKFRLAAEPGVFGQSLYEIVGPSDIASAQGAR